MTKCYKRTTWQLAMRVALGLTIWPRNPPFKHNLLGSHVLANILSIYLSF